jgi:hypothetical protein
MRVRIVAAVALAAALSAAAPSSARTEKPPAAPAPAAVTLAWNANAVAAVRAATVIDPPGSTARPLYQTEGLLYRS